MQGEENILARRPSGFDLTEITITPAEDENDRQEVRSPSPEEVLRTWRQSPTPTRQR